MKSGGNLVLTDGAMKMLSRFKIVQKRDIQRTVHNAGHIDIEDFDDRYLKKVHTTASQTYYEVPLGYSVEQDSAPHVTVARSAWEEAGGKSLAYITDEERIGLGRVKLGRGTIGILGALLPKPTEEFDHFFGLARLRCDGRRRPDPQQHAGRRSLIHFLQGNVLVTDDGSKVPSPFQSPTTLHVPRFGRLNDAL